MTPTHDAPRESAARETAHAGVTGTLVNGTLVNGTLAVPRRLSPAWFIVLVLGSWVAIQHFTSTRLPDNWMVNAQESVSMSGEGGYLFFAFRRSLWTVNKATGKIVFHVFPETSENDQEVRRSRSYTLNQDDFPLDQVRFLVSERNLTNYLWISNPYTGKARFIKARRDDFMDESPLLDITKE